MQEYLTLITNTVETWGIWFIVPFLFLENVPVIGFIAPGLTVLFLSGFFADILPGHPVYIATIACITIIIADNLWFWLGYYGNSKTPFLKRVAAQSPNVEATLANQSFLGLIMYQFMPYFRMFLPFSLGMYRFSPAKWLLVNALATFLYVFVFFGAGWVTKNVVAGAPGAVLTGLNYLIGVVAIVYFGALVYRYIRMKRES